MMFNGYGHVCRQRQEFRASGGKMKIWGKDPEYIEARYTVDGKECTALLLYSGWWGLARLVIYIVMVIIVMALVIMVIVIMITKIIVIVKVLVITVIVTTIFVALMMIVDGECY
jgi:hypothetical protein